MSEGDVYINISSRIVAEGDSLPSGEIEWARKLATSIKMRDDDSQRLLACGLVYPVIVVLEKGTRRVLVENGVKMNECEFRGKCISVPQFWPAR
jgi:hypothetical protein